MDGKACKFNLVSVFISGRKFRKIVETCFVTAEAGKRECHMKPGTGNKARRPLVEAVAAELLLL